jgi:hypothetical protein
MIVASLFVSNVGTAHAQPYSVNMIANPGFESPFSTPPTPGWQGDIYDDGNYFSTVTINNTIAHTGLASARLDVSSNETSIRFNTTASEFHITLLQYLPVNLLFSNLTNRPDSLSLWFQIQPKFTNYALLEIRIRAGSGSELDYFYSNPSTGIGFGNSTTGSENGKPISQIIMPAPPLNHWNHLARNLKNDWTAPIKLPNGTFVSGALMVNDTLFRIEADALFYKNPGTGDLFAETAWIDDVAAYADSPNQGPPNPPSNYYASFNFQDAKGNPVNNLVKWKLFNSTGYEVTGYAQNSPTLLLEPYTIEVYYPTFTGQNPEPYRILRQRITLNIAELISLPMYPQSTLPWVYVAFNNTLTQPIRIINETPAALEFNAQGTNRPYTTLVNVTSKPVAIQINNGDPANTNWSYDQTLSLVKIQSSTLGNFSIFVTPPLTIPSINFQDITGNQITANISWKILDSTGTLLEVVPGELVPDGTYTFQAYYYHYKIYSNGLTSTPTSLRLQMLSLGTQQKGYVAFNSTVSSIAILENSSTELRFTAVGRGSYLVVANVPAKPVSIERDGTTISSWTYNATAGTVAIETSQLGTFTIAYSDMPSFSITYIGVAIVLLAVAVIGALLLRRKMSTKNPTQTLKEEQTLQENVKSENKKPRPTQ